MNLPGLAGSVSSLVAAGDRARDASDWPAAETAYRAALGKGARIAPFNVQLGHALKEQGRLEDAEQCYRKALDADEKNADTHLQLGHVLKLQGRLTEAAAAYKRACDLDPETPDAALEYRGLTGIALTQITGKMTVAELDAIHGLISALRKSNAPTYQLVHSLPPIAG